jgi:D-lactate dehydrogenase
MPLFAPDPMLLAPPPGEPAPDRAPDELAAGTPAPLRKDLEALLGTDRVLARAIDLVAYASDASPYRLLPKAVVMAHDAADVARTMSYGAQAGVPVTFRAGGTSLNGQAQGDGILIDVRRHFAGVAVQDGGATARVRPGTVLGRANAFLARHGRKLGPDPASTDAATVGGVIANNSGGMRCGTWADSYSTVRAMTLVLPSGTVIDTEAPDAEERFAQAEPELARGLLEIRDEIRADAELAERIRRKFEIKNTTGYRLVAFLDADTPLEIFRRLVVGSEGTLAFVAEAVFDTVPLDRHLTTGLLLFPSIDSACAAVPGLVDAGARAVELMVALTLRTARGFPDTFPGAPESWDELPFDGAVLLVELAGESEDELAERERAALEALAEHELLQPPEFTRDRALTELYWKIREGMFGIVGILRPPGTLLITEDVCVPPAQVAQAAKDIQGLLAKHGFLTGVAGHASAGNLHFLLTPDFSAPADRDRYDAFMHELADLVVDTYDGSLKAEHGTGRNMAPYVEREWGPKATEMMWRIKQLADPHGVLAPGIVLNRDPDVHLRDLKAMPRIEEVADACIECGFCDPVCPSRGLTTTPRQRIVIRREMARQPAGSPLQRALLEQYEYDAIETCAGDGSCRIACPVQIDTGKLVKGFRARQHGRSAERVALRAADRWSAFERAARGGLRAGHAAAAVVGERPVRAATEALRGAVGPEAMPAWTTGMPAPAPPLPATERSDAAAVYFPACINRIFGPRSVPGALVEVSARAGLPLWIPPDVAGHCCATPWSSKGFGEGAGLMANRVVERLWSWSGEGALPIVIDATSCTLGLSQEVVTHLSEANRARHGALRIVDSIAWAHDELLPRLRVGRRVGAATVHPTCATRHLGLTERLSLLAASLADEVEIPVEATCCGFAGDRGFLHPELAASATSGEAAEVGEREWDAHLCSNRTCEVGLERATGRPWRSFVFLLEELSRD